MYVCSCLFDSVTVISTSNIYFGILGPGIERVIKIFGLAEKKWFPNYQEIAKSLNKNARTVGKGWAS